MKASLALGKSFLDPAEKRGEGNEGKHSDTLTWGRILGTALLKVLVQNGGKS